MSTRYQKPSSWNQARSLLYEWAVEMNERDHIDYVISTCADELDPDSVAHLELLSDDHNERANHALYALIEGDYRAYHDKANMGAPTLFDSRAGKVVCVLNPRTMEEV